MGAIGVSAWGAREHFETIEPELFGPKENLTVEQREKRMVIELLLRASAIQAAFQGLQDESVDKSEMPAIADYTDKTFSGVADEIEAIKAAHPDWAGVNEEALQGLDKLREIGKLIRSLAIIAGV